MYCNYLCYELSTYIYAEKHLRDQFQPVLTCGEPVRTSLVTAKNWKRLVYTGFFWQFGNFKDQSRSWSKAFEAKDRDQTGLSNTSKVASPLHWKTGGKAQKGHGRPIISACVRQEHTAKPRNEDATMACLPPMMKRKNRWAWQWNRRMERRRARNTRQ